MYPIAHRSLLIVAAAVFAASLPTLAWAEAEPQAGEQPQAQAEAKPQPAQGKPGQRPKQRRNRPSKPGRNSFPPGIAEARLVKERAEVIGVDEETLEKLEALVTEQRAAEEELNAQITSSRAKVQAELDKARPDEKALMAAAANGTKANSATRVLRLSTSLKVRALLTDEELEKFMEIRKKALGPRSRPGAGRPGR